MLPEIYSMEQSDFPKPIIHSQKNPQFNMSSLTPVSGKVEEDMRAYMSLSVEEVAKSECPLMFISFPSAKDPNWEQKYPGEI